MFGLSSHTVSSLCGVFSKYPQIEEVVIYGSRARGTYHEGSDIDLTIKGKEMRRNILYKLEEDIEDLLLPYCFDISIYAELRDPDFINSINREGKTIYSAATTSGTQIDTHPRTT